MKKPEDSYVTLSGVDLSFLQESLPKIPVYNQIPNPSFNSISSPYKSEIEDAVKQIQERKQKEFENQEALVRLGKEQNELLALQVAFLKNMDGNTQEILKKFNELIPSQYAEEAIQHEMLEIIKAAATKGDYWDEIKAQLTEIMIGKGVEYLIAFIVMAIKFSVGMGI